MDDEKIIQLYFERSEKAITHTSKKYGKMCRRIAWNILRSNEDSEECVNDTWFRAWEKIPPNCPVNLGAFLARITRNLSINLWHRRGRGQSEANVCIEELYECLPDKKNEAEEISEKMVLTDAFNRFLTALKPTAQSIFVKRYWYVCPIKEIAAELSMTEGAVKVQLSRTRKELREFFEKEGIEI